LTLQAHVLVPGPATVHVALALHPPLKVAQELIGAHTVPLPEYPVLQAQVLMPAPVLVQLAFGSQPPEPMVQLLIGAQLDPSPA
jgi:hypothetical protein